MQKNRIWELDALRGFCIVCVVVVHCLFDLTAFTDVSLKLPVWYLFIKQYGGVIFVILSGVCATLGSRSVLRGGVVFGAGMLITIVTAVMAQLGLADGSIVVKFGVLHLLGISMLLYPLYKNQPTAAVLAQAVLLIALGYFFSSLTVKAPFLFPFGLCAADFVSGDYFPLLPHFGWFLLGVCIGRTLYKEKKSLASEKLGNTFPMRFFRFCGRQSLWIYLLHQPLLYGVMMLILACKK